MGLRLFFLPNFPGATFIQGAAFIPDSRVNVQSNSSNKQYFKIGNTGWEKNHKKNKRTGSFIQ